MSSSEFSLWLAMYRKAPWDDTRGDIQAALICSTQANYAGKTRAEGAAPASPADYMPFLEQRTTEPEEPDPMDHFGKF